MTSEERREAQARGMSAGVYGLSPSSIKRAVPYLDRLLAWLDEHQPTTAHLMRNGDPEDEVTAKIIREGWPSDAVRDAAKYGVSEIEVTADPYEPHTFVNQDTDEVFSMDYEGTLFEINYPEEHPKA
jgi:hypothetical protein